MRTQHNINNMIPVTRKNVSFSDVSVRNYDICIGDSPSTLVGVPLSLDWTFTEADRVTVDEFEMMRPPTRSKEELKIPACDRYRKLIVDFGVPANDIKQVLRRAVILKGGRRRSSFGEIKKSIASSRTSAPPLLCNKSHLSIASRAQLPLLSKYQPRSTGSKAA